MTKRSTSARKGDKAGRGRWSLEPKDLSKEWNLKGAQEIEVDGKKRPALGRYALFARLGKGAMGIVYFGVNPRLGTEVAIKVLPHALLEQNEIFAERFLREARFAAQINSPHLVKVLDVDEDDHSGCHFIVMEYVKGMSAAVWRNRFAHGAPEREALSVAIAACKGIAAAHEEGIVHRDMKPDNVIIPTDRDGRPRCENAKVADLGIARGEDTAKSLTGTRAAMGTPGYLSPEQATDAKRAKKPADVFGIGATLYSLITGKAPFAGSNPTDALIKTIKGEYPFIQNVRADVSEMTAKVVGRCLRQKPDDRYPDALALLGELEECRNLVGSSLADAPTPRSMDQDTGSFVEDPAKEAKTPAVPEREEKKDDEDMPAVGVEAAIAAAEPTGEVADEADDTDGAALLLEPEDPISDGGGGPSTDEIFGEKLIDTGSIESIASLSATETKLPQAQTGTVTRQPVGDDAGLILSCGVPGARVALTAEGGSAPAFRFECDESGRLHGVPVPPGTYTLVVSSPGFEPYESLIEVERRTPLRMEVDLEERAGSLSVTSKPSKAKVLVDGEAVGTTPLDSVPLAAGEHQVKLRAEQHASKTVTVVIRGDCEERLENVKLTGWGVIDLSKLRAGVVALVNGRRMNDRERVPPKGVTVVLKRRGYAPQKRKMKVPPGKGVRIKALPWDRYLAKIDVTNLADDITAWVDGKQIEETIGFDKSQEVEVELRRPRFESQFLKVEVKVGKTVSVPPGSWTRNPGKIDLGRLPTDVRAEIDGERVEGVITRDPGSYIMELSRPRHGAQRVRVKVEPDGTAVVKAKKWTHSILHDLDRWVAALPEERRAAAESVAATTRGFELKGLETFSAGGEEHEIAILADDYTGLEFSLIPAGHFIMGSPADEEGRNADERMHEVTLTDPFLIARTEVTQGVWEHVMESNPAVFKNPEHPVERVSWLEVQEFCEKTGLALPTEAQWEYACRAGTMTPFFFGLDPEDVDDYAWHSGNANKSTQPVGAKKPNAFGLYDMLGNVWEWCQDEYEDYTGEEVTDPVGKSGSGVRVLRGGSWNFTALFARCAFRRKNAPGNRFISLGFRAARSVQGV